MVDELKVGAPLTHFSVRWRAKDRQLAGDRSGKGYFVIIRL